VPASAPVPSLPSPRRAWSCPPLNLRRDAPSAPVLDPSCRSFGACGVGAVPASPVPSTASVSAGVVSDSPCVAVVSPSIDRSAVGGVPALSPVDSASVRCSAVASGPSHSLTASGPSSSVTAGALPPLPVASPASLVVPSSLSAPSGSGEISVWSGADLPRGAPLRSSPASRRAPSTALRTCSRTPSSSAKRTSSCADGRKIH